MIIDCKSIAQDIKNKIKNIIKNIIAEADYAPVLYIYQVGDNPASNAYIRGKLRDCEEVGIDASELNFSVRNVKRWESKQNLSNCRKTSLKTN